MATRNDVAEYLNVPVKRLDEWAWQGKGPKFTRLSSRVVRYAWSDVEKWLSEQETGGQKAAA